MNRTASGCLALMARYCCSIGVYCTSRDKLPQQVCGVSRVVSLDLWPPALAANRASVGLLVFSVLEDFERDGFPFLLKFVNEEVPLEELVDGKQELELAEISSTGLEFAWPAESWSAADSLACCSWEEERSLSLQENCLSLSSFNVSTWNCERTF